MDKKYKDALNRFRVELVQDMHPLYVSQALNFSELAKLIQSNMYSQPYNHHESERKRKLFAEQILDTLLQRGNSDFDTFLKCLSEKCDQKHLSDQLRRHVEDDLVGVNLDELLGSQNNFLNNNRIRIADLNPSVKGSLQFQVVHIIKVTKETSVDDTYSFFAADDTGGINILARGNNGKILFQQLKKNGFYQISDWDISPRKPRYASLSNHFFDVWLNRLEKVKLSELPVPAIPLAGPIIPLNQLDLVSVDRVVTSSEKYIDVIGIVSKNGKFCEHTKKKIIGIKNSKSKKEDKFVAVNCELKLREQSDAVTKLDTIIIIQNAQIAKPYNNDKYLVAERSSFIFVVDENFQESWLPENQRHFIRDLRPKSIKKATPLQSSAILNAFSISNGLKSPAIFSSPPRPVPSTSGVSSIPRFLTPTSSSPGCLPRMLNTPPQFTAPSTSSPSNSYSATSRSTYTPLPRKNLFPQSTLFDVLQTTINSSSNRLTWTVGNAKISQFDLFQYEGCPNDSCTKKREGSNLPYTCTGLRCRGSPLKQEVKIRYRSVFCLTDSPTIIGNVKMFDEGIRTLFGLLELNAQTIAKDEVKTRVESLTYNVQLTGRRDNHCPWEYTVEHVAFPQT